MQSKKPLQIIVSIILVFGVILYIRFADERTVNLEPVEVQPDTTFVAEPDGLTVKEPCIPELVLETFQGEVGVRQVGNNRGKRVEEYLATTGLDGGYAWCAAFVSWGFDQHEIDNPNSAWSPAWFPSSNTIYTKGQAEDIDFQESDVIGIWFENLGRIAHVGVVESSNSQYVISIEGNTNDTGSRTGDGVYKKRRMQRQIHSVSRWVEPCIFNEQK